MVVWSYLAQSGLPTRLRPVKRYLDKYPDVPTLIGSFTFKDGSIGRFRATTGELLSRTYINDEGDVVHELHDDPVYDLLFPANTVRNAPRTVFSAIQRQRGTIVCDTFSCRVTEVTDGGSVCLYDTVDSSSSSSSPRLAFPSDAVLVDDKFILVADTSNNRVVQFDTEHPETPGEVVLSGLCRPTCLAFDGHLSMLYIVLLTTQVFAWRYGTPSHNLAQLDKNAIGRDASIQQLDAIGSGRLLASMRFGGNNVAVILEPDFD
ncbi:hypothetical protein Pmar_PMAR005662 [Perkinsus marinus ATCC 50983]|uniref:NHL repeat-containing protein n=1 Tax=Perkinsus marinus (strain ATCC 50983 / TXsc) TaxID=423536 RepID=C5M0Y7_PERM5|nr:hypothetical protein Pmar_PMAR005662 [Perkinsus marinus ATCC 50983]EEQ97355.1 hypothetical protein Pmar_PMAR005662 [Perkinsus marinus ATCC 50983]|eukprot:XP_002764638.1 hypothetical protein Pmar_PMAR005662 [Perkinsus marinus ATCC 50983]